MKKRYVLIPLLLLAVVILAITVFAADSEIPQASTTYREISYTYTPGQLKQQRTISSTFPYSDAMLLGDANEFSGDVAKASVALAALAYDRDQINTVLKDRMGYETLDNSAAYEKLDHMTVWDNDYAAYTIAYRDVQYNGELYRIYCIPVKGTGNAEWFSNLNLGTGPEHEGFRLSANRIYQDLLAISSDDNFDADHSIFWLTGHSRGAAVSNLVAGWLSERSDIKAKHVFGYTFACPSNSKNADTSLKNIYNFNDPGDLVPLLPLEDWGYKRYGITIEEFDDAIVDNIAYQFKRVSGETLTLNSRSHWLTFLHKVAPTQASFYLEQSLFYIAAWAIGGKNQATFPELLNYLGYSDTELIIQKLSGVSDTSNLKSAVESLSSQYGAYSKTAEQMIDEMEGMTEEEQAQYIQNHAESMRVLASASGMQSIGSLQLLKAAYVLITRAGVAAVDIGAALVKGEDLYFDELGNVMTEFNHGHTMLTYTTWMNAAYFGRNGWYGYPNACSVTIDNTKLVGSSCFYNCTGLTSVTIPDWVDNVEQYAFSGCTDMKTLQIDSSSVNLKQYSFRGCTGLTTVTMPVDLAPANNAFSGCTNVETIHYTKGKSGVMVNRQISSAKPMYYNATLEYISRASLTNVDFAEGVTHIGDYAFSKCSSLPGIFFPDSVRSIGRSAFEYCSGLTSVIIPDSVRSIGRSAFEYCSGLTSITIPDSLPSIESYAFGNCTALAKVTMPVDLTPANYSFYNCTNVKDIYYTSGKTGVMADRNTSSDYPMYYKATLEFISREQLRSVAFESGVTHIGDFAFGDDRYNSSYGEKPNGVLQNIRLPDTVKTIGVGAFSDQKLLQTLDLPDNVEQLGGYCFYACIGLTEMPMNNTLSELPSGCFRTCPGLKEITIPSNIKTVGRECFKSCSSVTSATIEEGVQCVEYYAFSNCIRLETLIIESSNLDLKTSVFENCVSLKTVTIPVDLPRGIDFCGFDALSTIHYTKGKTGVMTDRQKVHTFSWNLTSVDFEEGVRHIGDYAFSNCGLRNIEMPNSVTSIGEHAFYNCYGLTSLSLPDSVTSIGEFAFAHCDVLKDILIPDSVTNIGVTAFGYCKGLKIVTMPVDLNLPDSAFYGCNNVSTIHYTKGKTGVRADRQNDTTKPMYYQDTLEYYSRSTLTSVEFDKGIQRLGNFAFASNTALRNVYYAGSQSEWNSIDIGSYNAVLQNAAFHEYSTIYASITAHPADRELPTGYLARFSVKTTGDGVSYQWQYSEDGGETWQDSGMNSSAVFCTVSEETDGRLYRCIVTDKLGRPIVSRSASLTLNDAFVCTHTETELRDVVDATCTEEGFSGDVYCAVCGEKLEDGSATPALNHSETTLSGAVEPTCTEDGYTGDTVCAFCGELMESGSAIPALGHSWDEGVVTLEPTGSAEGVKTFTCTVCGETRTEVIPKLSNPFTDVAAGKFYHDPVLWAISQDPQITTGVDSTHFEPDRICTRAHVVTFLWRANGCPEPTNTTNTFKDVPNGKYYTKAVLWAAETGITTGYSDGTFRPDDECTRGQVVTFLWRAKGQTIPASMSNPFTDVPSGKYYTNAVLWALENGITQGRTSTTFGPEDSCTRGHVVTFLYRAYN